MADSEVEPPPSASAAHAAAAAAPLRNRDCKNLRTCIAHIQQSPLCAELPAEITAATLDVLQHWLTNFSHERKLDSFINNKAWIHEIEESLVTVREVHAFLTGRAGGAAQAEEDGAGGGGSGGDGELGGGGEGGVALYDLCSGKGFVSMLVAYLVPRIPSLAGRIAEVVMVDKNGENRNKMNLEHVHASNADPTSIPIRFLQADIHDARVVRDLGLAPETRGIVVAVHLCNRLSSRCAEIFTRCPGLDCLVLSPCCIPRGRPISLNEHELDPAVLREGGRVEAYDRWVSFLHGALQEGDKSTFHAPLQGGALRKNQFIVARRPLGREVEVGEDGGSEPPDDQVCKIYYHTGKCSFKGKCKFRHLRGARHWC